MNVLLASTSSLYKEKYFEYLTPEIVDLFKNIKEITFIPFARPGGMSHDCYTKIVHEYFLKLDIKVKGLHTYSNIIEAIEQSQAFFTGGGNTFLLVKMLHELRCMETLAKEVKKGKPYLGSSAGSNIAGVTMQTTNDMPIVYPPSYDCLGLIPYNINPHYLSPIPNFPHNGETRETRIKEYLSQNNIPVIGLREGNWIRVSDQRTTVEGKNTTRIFEKNKEPYEISSGTELEK